MRIDSIDKKILEELQKNSSIPLSELSKKVGLSNTPCWNRIKKLEEEINKLNYYIENSSKKEKDARQTEQHGVFKSLREFFSVLHTDCLWWNC